MKDYIWVVEIRMNSGEWLPMAHEGYADRSGARLFAAQRRRKLGQKVRVRKYQRVGK